MHDFRYVTKNDAKLIKEELYTPHLTGEEFLRSCAEI